MDLQKLCYIYTFCENACRRSAIITLSIEQVAVGSNILNSTPGTLRPDTDGHVLFKRLKTN